MEFLRQPITQAPAANTLGTISFTNATAWAIPLSQISWTISVDPPLRSREFLVQRPFHPDRFRQSYFFQDNWKTTPALTLTLGLRYENFGQPANSLPYPAFSGFDPAQFLVRHEVTSRQPGLRTGFRIGMVARRRALAGLEDSSAMERPCGAEDIRSATTTPSSHSCSRLARLFRRPMPSRAMTTATNAGRGSPNWFEQRPSTASTARLTDAQNATRPKSAQPLHGAVVLRIRAAIAAEHRAWMFPTSVRKVIRLTTRADWNPRLLTGVRLYPNLRPVTVRTSEGNSSYHALQTRLDRRFGRGLQLVGVLHVVKVHR